MNKGYGSRRRSRQKAPGKIPPEGPIDRTSPQAARRSVLRRWPPSRRVDPSRRSSATLRLPPSRRVSTRTSNSTVAVERRRFQTRRPLPYRRYAISRRPQSRRSPAFLRIAPCLRLTSGYATSSSDMHVPFAPGPCLGMNPYYRFRSRLVLIMDMAPRPVQYNPMSGAISIDPPQLHGVRLASGNPLPRVPPGWRGIGHEPHRGHRASTHRVRTV